MKFLKKASLAASIAAVSFAANAELVAMDEASMSATTGQAGVDIDITLGYDAANPTQDAISIGRIVYTDTADANNPNDVSGGGLAIDGIGLRSATGEDVVIYNAIDINADGDIIMDSTATNAQLLLSIGSVDTLDSNGNVAANLVGASTIDMTITGSKTVITQVLADVDGDGTAAESQTIISNAAAYGGEAGTITVNSADLELLNGAVGLKGLTTTALSAQHTLKFDANGVGVSDLDLSGTINIANVELGGTSIGSLAIENLALNNTSIQISGH